MRKAGIFTGIAAPVPFGGHPAGGGPSHSSCASRPETRRSTGLKGALFVIGYGHVHSRLCNLHSKLCNSPQRSRNPQASSFAFSEFRCMPRSRAASLRFHWTRSST